MREIRVSAAAGETSPYPNAFADVPSGMPDPAPMSEVAASEAHLAALADRQPRASAGEIRAGEARAAALRRLGKLRARQAELAIQSASKKR